MKHIKALCLAAALIGAALFMACAAPEAAAPENAAGTEAAMQTAAAQTAAATADQSGFAWGISMIRYEMTASLNATAQDVQYSGESVEKAYTETPAEGNVFLLTELAIDKNEAGAATFEWSRLYVTDSAANKYSRHPNDTFLDVYGYARIKSTDLTIGNNTGFACFEIPAAAAEGELFLVYDAPEGKNTIKIK